MDRHDQGRHGDAVQQGVHGGAGTSVGEVASPDDQEGRRGGRLEEDLSGPPNNWDHDTIEHNMFEPYSRDETNFTRLDADSIMM